NIPINTNLTWTGGDPDGNPVTYDVYLGTNSTPPKIASNITETTYNPGTLQNLTTYYWKIIAWDNQSASTEGPTWNFQTEQPNQPPYQPSNPNPANNSNNIPINTNLTWTGGDPDGNPVTYDVYFGTDIPPQLVSSNQSENFYQPDVLNFNTTYYWKIIAWDNYSASTTGPEWNFKTYVNNPPYQPSDPKPYNGAINVEINANLKWTCGDPDGDFVTYDIYFGDTFPLQKVESNYTTTSYYPGTMKLNTTYYWKIVAWDAYNYSTEGQEWYFTTTNKLNSPPISPVIDGVIGVVVPERAYNYTFNSIDPDQDDVFYFVDWGDGTFEDWIGPCLSGKNISLKHTWPAKTKIYQIKAKAKDIYGAESDYGTFLVFVLNPRTSRSQLFVRIMQRLPILQKILMIFTIINKIPK
ncbi:MAG: hypothetical protein QHH15_04275, partial [Candidatus Thermoplasmatota archaeon]|nr:hypothetical protein [Candidatus Thermoplasmatota archaeon]